MNEDYLQFISILSRAQRYSQLALGIYENPGELSGHIDKLFRLLQNEVGDLQMFHDSSSLITEDLHRRYKACARFLGTTAGTLGEFGKNKVQHPACEVEVKNLQEISALKIQTEQIERELSRQKTYIN